MKMDGQMTQLWAVRGDPNSHGGGALISQNPQTVYVNSITVIEHPDPASPDSFCPAGPHCNPATARGSSRSFVYSNPIHRDRDSRVCGAVTTVALQSTVFVG